MRFFIIFSIILSGCTISIPESEVKVDEETSTEITDSGNIGTDEENVEFPPIAPDNNDNTETTDNTDISNIPDFSEENRKYDTVCQSALPPGMMDLAIQKDGYFYETAARLNLKAKTSFSPDIDTAQRLMYGPNMRMWARVPELIKVVDGRGSGNTELCLTIGNVNCRYIWGAKLFELDVCDFGVQPNDILGALFFSLEVHNSLDAPDMTVMAELEVLSDIR